MGAFTQGVESGRQQAANPFGVILSGIREAEARRLKEDEARRDEEGKLKQAMLTLGKKHEFDKSLAEFESDLDIAEKGEPIAQAMKRFGLGGGTTELPAAGTPIDTPAATPTGIPAVAPTGTPTVDQGQSVLKAAGLARGKVVTNSKGEEFFIPEDISEEKTRLQTEKLRRESTPEGREQLVKEEAASKAKIKEATDKVVAKTKVTLGRLVSRNNLEAVSGQFSDLANLWVDSFKEGGAGGIIQSGIAKTATKLGDLPKFLGGAEIGGRFSKSGSYEGKKTETLLKMMPMLTQQGLKSEGSVRIITTVLEALGLTLPELATAAKTARNQFAESQKSFFRFARAAELLGEDFDTVFEGQDPNNISDEALKGWAVSVNRLASRVKVEGAEADAFDNLVDTSLSRFDEIIKRDKSSPKVTAEQKSQFNSLRASGMSKEEARKKVGF